MQQQDNVITHKIEMDDMQPNRNNRKVMDSENVSSSERIEELKATLEVVETANMEGSNVDKNEYFEEYSK